MKLGTKIIAGGLAAVTLSVAVALLVQRHIIRNQDIELTRNTMRTALLEAENVRETISRMNEQNAFNRPKLIEEYKHSGDLRGSTLYQTIPVVAAWKAIQETAEKEGYEFRVPKRQARNEKNNPTPEEEKILDQLESAKASEYFHVDDARNEIVYARPIVLSADCLACHGNPKDSLTGDGKDMLGYPMENWNAGEVHGAFVLRSSLDHVNQAVRAGVTGTVMWILPVALAIGAGFYWLNRNLIVRPLNATICSLNSASDEIASAASQVSASSTTLAEGASEQAAAIEETGASLEELASMNKRNSENAQQANQLTKQANAAAIKGMTDMQAMNDAMAAIKGSSDDISKIIKTIDEIAFQTNILALNAAVEAARAGEAGMGFAVVADEVRTLAQRSAQAAKETASKIEAAVGNSNRGVEISATVAATLDEILVKVRQVDELATEVAAASREQTTGISQINTAIIQMDKVTQGNAASSEESAAAAAQLSAQSGMMKESVAALLKLVSADRGNPVPGDRHPKPPIKAAIPTSAPATRSRRNRVSVKI